MSLYFDDSDDERLSYADPSTAGHERSEATTVPAEEESGAPGLVFQYLNPRDPHKARDRVGRLYWVAWKRLLQSFFLLMFGVTFLVIGIACMKLCDDFDRGIAFLVVGLIMFMPGMYGSLTLLWYVRGHPGYSYKMLPDMH